jgi:Fe2+ transport system protein FeoA
MRVKKINLPKKNQEKKETLADIIVSDKAIVLELKCEGAYRRRLLDLGLIPGTEVTAVMISPLGTPKAYNIRNSIIALRQIDASKIIIKKDREEEK